MAMRFVKNGVTSALILILAVSLWGCPYSHSGAKSEKTVFYTVNGTDIIHNADTDYQYTVVGKGTDYRVLTWQCGNYRFHERKKVVLTFKKINDVWVLDGEDISSGNCD
jgi:hypothetical protein